MYFVSNNVKVNKMKVGDKVRFLSETGGGIVSGFQGKDIVLVQDEDGFDIPMLINQVVVIDTDDYNIAKVNTGTHQFQSEEQKAMAEKESASTSLKAALNRTSDEPEEESDPADREISFVARPQERRGGNLLNVYLAFLPGEKKETTNQKFSAYLVNDSNYYLQVLYMSSENANWKCRFMATMEPNTKQHIEEFDYTMLNDLEHLCVQVLAYKTDKTFMLKPALSVRLRIDPVKFYKIHTFQRSPFFREPALVYDVIRDDKPQGVNR